MVNEKFEVRLTRLKREAIDEAFAILNQDSILEDVKVLWHGQYVLLLSEGGKTLTTLEADLKVQEKILRWCQKNSYRCTQIHDGRIWL